MIRGYEKRLKALPTTPESAAAFDESHDPTDVLGVTSRLSKEAVNRVVSEQKKRDERHQKFSKRRTLYVLIHLLLFLAIIRKKLIISTNAIVLTTVSLIAISIVIPPIFVRILNVELLCKLTDQLNACILFLRKGKEEILISHRIRLFVQFSKSIRVYTEVG